MQAALNITISSQNKNIKIHTNKRHFFITKLYTKGDYKTMYDKEFNKPLNVNSIKDIGNLGNLFYYNNLNRQLEQEVGDFLRANTNTPHLYSNDLRHQYVSALYARNLGENWARGLGELNELTNLSGSGREDTNVDKFNNNIGIQYGLNNPTMPKEELLNTLLNDHEKNRSLYKFTQKK